MAKQPEPVSIIPARGERALFVGQTGSGKTALAVWVIKRIPRGPVVIYDTKNESKFLALQPSIVVTTFDELLAAYNAGEHDYIIVRPPPHLIGDAITLDDEYLFRHYMELAGVDCYIDELKSFHAQGRAYKGLVNLLERGRSRGITTIMSTQRPSWISVSTLSEAQKIFILFLKYEDDIKRMAKFVPEIVDRTKLKAKTFQFYYYDGDADKLTLFNPVELDSDVGTGDIDETTLAEPDADRKRGLIWS